MVIYIYIQYTLANHLPIFISKIFPEESSQHLLRVQHFDQHTEFTLGIDLSLFEELVWNVLELFQFPFPDAQGMVYLPTFGLNLW